MSNVQLHSSNNWLPKLTNNLYLMDGFKNEFAKILLWLTTIQFNVSHGMQLFWALRSPILTPTTNCWRNNCRFLCYDDTLWATIPKLNAKTTNRIWYLLICYQFWSDLWINFKTVSRYHSFTCRHISSTLNNFHRWSKYEYKKNEK